MDQPAALSPVQRETKFLKGLISRFIDDNKDNKIEKNELAEKSILAKLQKIVDSGFDDLSSLAELYSTILLSLKQILVATYEHEYEKGSWFNKTRVKEAYRPTILDKLTVLHGTILQKQQDEIEKSLKEDKEKKATQQNEQALAAQQAKADKKEEKKRRKAAEEQAREAQNALRLAEQQKELELKSAALDKREAVAKVTEEMAKESRAAVAQAGYDGIMFAVKMVTGCQPLAELADKTFQAQGGFQHALLLAYTGQTVGETQESQADDQPKTELQKCEEIFDAKFPIISPFIDLYNSSKSETEKLMVRYINVQLSFHLHHKAEDLLVASAQFFMSKKIIPALFPKFEAVMKSALAIAKQEGPVSNEPLSEAELNFFLRRFKVEDKANHIFLPKDAAAIPLFGHHHQNKKNGSAIPEKGTEAAYQKAFEEQLKALQQSSPTFTLRAKAVMEENAATPAAAAPNGDNGHRQSSPSPQ